MQGTMPGARRRGRPRTAWMDNIKTWTGLSVEESIGMTEDRDKWRKYVHVVANPRIEDGYRTDHIHKQFTEIIFGGRCCDPYIRFCGYYRTHKRRNTASSVRRQRILRVWLIQVSRCHVFGARLRRQPWRGTRE